MECEANAQSTYSILDLNLDDSYCREALETTTSPGLWTIYIIQDDKIINHTIMFSEEDAWEYCERLVRNGLDYEITTPNARAVKVAAQYT